MPFAAVSALIISCSAVCTEAEKATITTPALCLCLSAMAAAQRRRTLHWSPHHADRFLLASSDLQLFQCADAAPPAGDRGEGTVLRTVPISAASNAAMR